MVFCRWCSVKQNDSVPTYEVVSEIEVKPCHNVPVYEEVLSSTDGQRQMQLTSCEAYALTKEPANIYEDITNRKDNVTLTQCAAYSDTTNFNR